MSHDLIWLITQTCTCSAVHVKVRGADIVSSNSPLILHQLLERVDQLYVIRELELAVHLQFRDLLCFFAHHFLAEYTLPIILIHSTFFWCVVGRECAFASILSCFFLMQR